MRCAVVWDEYIYRFKDEYYCTNFVKVLLYRYLNVFENVNLVSRTINVVDFSTISELERIQISESLLITELPLVQTSKEYAVNLPKLYFRIKKSLSHCDRAIIRTPSIIALIAYFCSRRLSLPFAVEVVANSKEISKNSNIYTEKSVFMILDFFQNRMCKNALAVGYVCRSLQAIYPSNVNAYIDYYSSIDLSLNFYDAPRELVFKKKYQIIHVSNVISDNNMKGHFTVVKVLKEIVSKGLNVNVEFVGNIRGGDSLKEYIKSLNLCDNVIFAGKLNKDQLRNELLQSDVFLFPSASEGLPRVLIEAGALGLPCIASNVGGIPDIVSEDCLFSVDDINGFASKVTQLLNCEDYYKIKSSEIFKTSLKYNNDVLNAKRTALYKFIKSK